MRGNFLQLGKLLLNHYPSLEGRIDGENYPPPPYALFLLNLAGYLQMGTLLLMIFGRFLFRLAGMAVPPAWFEHMMENKLQTFAIIFLASTVAASLTATGAFEVTYGGELVFSKLEAGRMPTAQEILRRLQELNVQ